jgi:hypothetical protein
MMNNGYSDIRPCAAEALVKLGNTSQEVINSLLSFMKARNQSRLSNVVSALVQLAKTPDTILPEVVQWLEQNQDEDVMDNAIDCLYSIMVE